jgi:serine protease AprX
VKSVGAVDIKEARSTGIIFATLTEEQASKLKSQGCTVTKVGGVKTAVMPPPPVAAIPVYTASQLIYVAGFEQLRKAVVPPLYGEGINVAVVDTGIRETHQQVMGRVIYSKNFTSDLMRDGFDHGTGVASIIVAIAPRCNILNIKVLDDRGSGTEEEAVLGIDHLLSLHDEGAELAPRIINLSLGSPDDGNPYNPLRLACRAAIERGIWVTAAAGNSGPSAQTIMSPACERYICAVGSCKLEPFIISDWSSRGPTKEGLVKPDAVFFGENIELASSASDTATTAKSGTSFASPFSAGAWALYYEGVGRQLSFQIERYPQYADILREAATRVISPESAIDNFLPRVTIKPQGVTVGKDNDYGYGLPFGPLVIEQFVPKATLDVVSLLNAVMLIGTVGIIVEKI